MWLVSVLYQWAYKIRVQKVPGSIPPAATNIERNKVRKVTAFWRWEQLTIFRNICIFSTSHRTGNVHRIETAIVANTWELSLLLLYNFFKWIGLNPSSRKYTNRQATAFSYKTGVSVRPRARTATDRTGILNRPPGISIAKWTVKRCLLESKPTSEKNVQSLVDWLTDWHWLNDRLTGWLTDCLTERPTYWLTKWLSD